MRKAQEELTKQKEVIVAQDKELKVSLSCGWASERAASERS